MIPSNVLPLANHLWQSSLFAGVAGLLALALRKHRASVRYWLWLAASIKFLVPFSLLISLGSQFHWQTTSHPNSVQISSWVGDISQPFTPQPSAPAFAAASPGPSQVPTILFTIWLCGAAVSAAFWLRSWLRVRSAVRTASSWQTGPLPIKITPELLEPCVFGIFGPVLLLPAGIHDRLTPEQLQPILLHELCHVRRRDNLAAALHMVTEVLFWFCPLVYWIGKRMMDERESACDEEVLRVTGRPEAYADGILAVCRFCLQSSMCAAGVTGSNLKKRIDGILQSRATLKLGLGAKLLLAAAGIAAVAGPIAVGLMEARPARAQSEPATRPRFEVASVKDHEGPRTGPRDLRRTFSPQGINFTQSLIGLIAEAYNLPGGRLVMPLAAARETLFGTFGDGYDVVANTDHRVPREQLRLMLQSLLAERFKMTVHHETKTVQVYRLVIAKGGPKLEESQDDGDYSISNSADGWVFRNAETYRVAGVVSSYTDRMAVDETGLTGLYNFTVKMPEELRHNPSPKSEGASLDKPSAAIFGESMKQLGLQLVAGNASVDYLVVDHVERPSGN